MLVKATDQRPTAAEHGGGIQRQTLVLQTHLQSWISRPFCAHFLVGETETTEEARLTVRGPYDRVRTLSEFRDRGQLSSTTQKPCARSHC